MVSFLRTHSLLLLLGIPFTVQANMQNSLDKNINSTTSYTVKINATGLYAKAAISKQMAAGIAQQYVPGRVLKVTFNGSVYRVKIVSRSGDVVNVLVDANTGQILNR